eukprot:2507717-Prymnesium_polylepis.1
MQVDETSSDVPPSPSSKASRKRPLSPPSSRPSQVSATSARNGDDTTRAQSASSSNAESSTQWHPGMPKKLLHLFAGPGGRSDGLRALARVLLRVDTVEIDTLIDEVNCDLLDDEVFADLMSRILAGEFFAVVIGTPCGTFSVARIAKHGVSDGGPPQLRDGDYAEGMPGLSTANQRIVDDSNLLVERSVAIARAIRSQAGSFVIENPATRSDKSSDLYRWVWRSHASLWMHKLTGWRLLIVISPPRGGRTYVIAPRSDMAFGKCVREVQDSIIRIA